MYSSIREFKIGNINVETFSENPHSDQIESIKKSVNKAFDNFNAAFCNGQKCSTANKINIYAANDEDEYKKLLNERGIDDSIKKNKFSALKDYGNEEFDIYFYLDRAGDFAYSTLERAIARVLIESNNVFKSALTPSFKTGIVDYVAGLDENGNVQDNNEDCRDFNKIIENNLSPYGILKGKNSEAQAEQVIKYLKQEHSKKINALFEGLTQNSKSAGENVQMPPKEVVNLFLRDLQGNKDLNSKFLEWTNKQLEQFHQRLAEKFVPKVQSKVIEGGTEIVIKYHHNNKIENIKTSAADTLVSFKNAFCNGIECKIPEKFNIFLFDSENQCKQYLCGNGKKFGKFFISNNKSGEASIYLYGNEAENNIKAVKAWVIEAIIKNNDWDYLPQQIRDGMRDYILDSNNNSYKNINLNEIKLNNYTPHDILNKFSAKSYLSGQVMEFLIKSKPRDMHRLLTKFSNLQTKDAKSVEEIVSDFMKGLKNHDQEFSNWVNEQLSQVSNVKSGKESTSVDQTQEQSTEGKQDFIDQVMSSSCITDLGIKPKCKDKLQDLIKALQECNEEPEEETTEPTKQPGEGDDKEGKPEEEIKQPGGDDDEEEPEKGDDDEEPGEGDDDDEEPEKGDDDEEEPEEETTEPTKQPGEGDDKEGKPEEEIKQPGGDDDEEEPEKGDDDEEPGEGDDDDEEPGEGDDDEEPEKGDDDEEEPEKGDDDEEEPEKGDDDEEPGEEVIEQPKASISNIFNNLRKALCNSQECHGVQKVNISTIDQDKFNDLMNSSAYTKAGDFIASNNGDVVDIKLNINYEKEPSALNFGSQTFVNPDCSYAPSGFNTNHEYGSYCAKAAETMLFLIQRHPDHLAYFFKELAKSGCENGDKIMQELDNYYNSELQTWLESGELI